MQSQQPEFGATITDITQFVKDYIRDHARKPTTREGIKAYAIVIVDRWGVHAATTATPVDDLLVAGLLAAVERYFDAVYDTLLDKIGSQGSPEFGSVSVEGLVDAIVDAPRPADEVTFGAPNGQVLELVKALLPIVLKWYFAV